MIRGVSRIAALSAVILAVGILPAEEEVLYWMVGADATVNDHGTVSSVSDFLPAETENSWSAARIRVTGGDIARDVFLDVYDSDGTLQAGSGELGIAFGDTGSGYWGAGVPTGNQSPLGDYAVTSPEYSFIIELGNVSWDGDSASWVETVAVSQSATYSDISRYIHTSFDPNPMVGGAWAPTTYNVPEPSGGLLLLVGGGLLLLRRRRADVT
jgi:hypothetical protein